MTDKADEVESTDSMCNRLLDASLEEMRKDDMDTLFCNHLEKVEGSPSCCSSCHADHDEGYDNLYEDEINDMSIKNHLCCAKRNWLAGI